MKPKVLGAIICAMIMVVCPLIPMALETEAADDSTGAATVKVTNLTKKQADELLGEDEVVKMIKNAVESPIGLNTSIYTSSSATYDVSEINLEEGSKAFVSGDNKSASSYDFYKLSCQFSFTYKVQSANNINILESYVQYQGEGMKELLKKYKDSTVKMDDTVKIYGKFTTIYVRVLEGKDVFHAADGAYWPSEIISTTKTMNSHDVTVCVKDTTFKDKLEVKTEMKTDTKYEFVNGEKIDYKEGKLESASANVHNLSKSSGTKTIDNSSYGYQSMFDSLSQDYSTGPQMSSLSGKLTDLDTTVHYKELYHFTKYVDDKAVTDTITKVNGTYSQDPAVFNKTYDPINSEASVGGSSDNTATIIGIVIAVIVVLALIALWYFKFRPTPEVKTEAPAQPEEPKNENQ